MVNIFIIAGEDRCLPAITLKSAIEQTLEAKRRAGRRVRYIDSLRQYLAIFSRGRESTPVQSFGLSEIEDWFTSRSTESQTTRASNLGRLSAMFDHCWRRGYIDENPCRKIERAFIERTAPRILSLPQCARVLIFTLRRQPDFLAWISLALLAGIRPEECDKLKWEHIDLERGEVRIDAAASKVRSRRIVHLSAAAVSWLRLAVQFGAVLPLSKSTRRRRIRRLRKALGFKHWPQDVLRHTAASYMLAAVGDAGKVAMELGNSAAILHRHYKALVQRGEGERFAALAPSARMVHLQSVPDGVERRNE